MENAVPAIEKLLLQLSQTKGASDLLITVGKPPQLRVYNNIKTLDYPVLTAEDTKRLCACAMNAGQAARFEKHKELDFSLTSDNASRFRVNIYRQKECMALVARIILEKVPGFSELNLPEIMARFAMLPRGLVLITGPIGCGKSTTKKMLLIGSRLMIRLAYSLKLITWYALLKSQKNSNGQLKSRLWMVNIK